jgi:ribosomal protein S1
LANAKTIQQSSVKPQSKGASSMDELMKLHEKEFVQFVRGTKVRAKIISISRREVVADIGAKSYGIIIGREFENISHLTSLLEIGKTYDAEVIIPEMEGGETLISLRRSLSDSLWTDLSTLQKEGTILRVTAERQMAGGLLVVYKTLRGFIPQQQLDPNTLKHMDEQIGKQMEVKILEIDQRQNRLVLSEREVTQANELAVVRKSLKEYNIEDTIEGEITGTDKYVVMVSVTASKKRPAVEGIIHISEVSWERVEKLSDVFNVGDTIKAKIIGINEADACLSLSVKQLSEDPWTGIDNRIKKDQQVKGKVVRSTNLGLFIELEKGVEGLLHVSKIPAGKTYEVGDKLTVLVDMIDTEKRKISLSVVETAKPIGYR